MRSFNGSSTTSLTVFILFCSLLFTGCAGKFIQTSPVSLQEEISISAAFLSMLANQQTCGCCLDAEVDVTIAVTSWLNDRSVTMGGFLQAMEPSYVKFISVNPLGQPLFIFITDGTVFQNVQVPKSKVYEGNVRSAAFDKYMPAWFEPKHGFYWLAGRLKPGNFEIISIGRDTKKKGVWLQLQYEGSLYRNVILFDPQKSAILRHVLMDNQEKPHIDVQYADYLPLIDETENGGNKDVERKNNTEDFVSCRLPGSIRIVSHDKSGQINLELHSFLPDSVFSEEDFTIDIPGGFKRLPLR